MYALGSSDDDSDGGRWPLPPDWTAAVSRRTGLRYWVNRASGEQSRSHPGRRAGRRSKEDRLAQGAAVIRHVARSASSGAKRRMLHERELSRSRQGTSAASSTAFDSPVSSRVALSPRSFARDSAGGAEDPADGRPRLDPMMLKLRHANGKHRHHREISLEAGRLTVHEKKHWLPGMAPQQPETHTVTGVRQDSAAANPLGFTVLAAHGEQVTLVAKNSRQKQLWVDALEETARLHKLAGSRAVRHQASGWERLVRRVLRRAKRRDHARLQNQCRLRAQPSYLATLRLLSLCHCL